MKIRATRHDWASVMNELEFSGYAPKMTGRLIEALENESPGWWFDGMPLDDKITLLEVEPDLYWFAVHLLWVIRHDCAMLTPEQAVEYAMDQDPDSDNEF